MNPEQAPVVGRADPVQTVPATGMQGQKVVVRSKMLGQEVQNRHEVIWPWPRLPEIGDMLRVGGASVGPVRAVEWDLDETKIAISV